MRRVKKPDFSAIEKSINPFSVSLVIKIHSIRQHLKGGRVNEVELELQTYTKVYRAPDNRLSVMELSPAALKLLKWIEYEVIPAKDYVWINRKRYMNEAKITSDNTVTNAIKELMYYGFIQITTVQQVYWINPTVFFCGSRINKYPNNIER